MKLKMIFMLNRAISLCKRLHGGYQGYSFHPAKFLSR